ncbi:MAG: hypothetical protein ACOCXT_05135 [Candidatus Dojkabacteria bacterium]
MIIKFKILFSSRNQWIGWFGEDVMKVRLNVNPQDDCLQKKLLQFIHHDLGIPIERMRLHPGTHPKLIVVEFPDEAWELFLCAIEK